MSDLTRRSATELSTMLSRREVSVAEVMEAHLAVIAERNPGLNALVSLAEPEVLMAEARAADDAEPRGPLHGLPLAVKDLANAADFPTSMGSPMFAGQMAEHDDLHVARLRAAGAIVIGKSNVPEFGLGSHSYNPVFGVTRNPGEPSLSAGGSSGGAAAALATGMVPLADGSDMMGSLRNPAGWCGIWSLRPSWGLVPGEPEGDLFLHQLSTLGPMGRTPADVELMLSVIAGPDRHQPVGGGYYRSLPGESPVGDRIGWLGDWDSALPMEEGVLRACEYQLARLTDAGASVVSVAAPFPAEALWESWTTLRSFAVAGSLGALLAQEGAELKPEAVWEIERGLALTASEVLRASAIRSDWYRRAVRLFETHDMLALPTAQCFPFPAEWDWPKEIAGQGMDSYHRWMEVVVPASLIGLPVVTMPIPGRRMGLQLIGPKGSDARLLAFARRYVSR
ncbi:amidase [Pseudoroseicyclus tamaricis]|uniref:Amidase n=1 Tax=Pseudoroseicyclus tamaricis TaxID=2705421 RepID=A0A6B2JYK8_9RHOB|nr:amidase [Pseudoroseicyclus tamaricis]NDV00452.1 amidase [Pseudoroseicyclus tamaricis]